MFRNMMFVLLLSVAGTSLAQTDGRISNRNATQIQGATIADIDIDLAQRMGLRGAFRGIVVTDVVPQSRAAYAGLLPGDLILTAQTVPVYSVTHLRDVMWRVGLNPVMFNVLRNGFSYNIVLLRY